jgi:ferredoxin-nitrite reductase
VAAAADRPRKWNVCVVGTHDLYEHPHINDLAYMPAVKDGRFGFNLLVGGFISPKRWGEALPLDAWVAGDDIIPVCGAILEAFRDLGNRGNRQKTRMMWLIDELVGFHYSLLSIYNRQAMLRLTIYFDGDGNVSM